MSKIIAMSILGIVVLGLFAVYVSAQAVAPRVGMIGNLSGEVRAQVGELMGEREQIRAEVEAWKNASAEERKVIAQRIKALRESAKEDLNDMKELREQRIDEFKAVVKERKGEFRFEGKNLTINELSEGKKELIIGKINAKTGLNLTVDDIGNGTVGSELRAYLSNGRWALVKHMPDAVSLIASEKMRMKCEERNCSVELKEVGAGNKTRLAYQVDGEKGSKLFFFIKKDMKVSAQVDAETGEVISVKKPWWAFMAKED